MKQAIRINRDIDPWHFMKTWNEAQNHDELLYSIRRVPKHDGSGEFYASAFARLYGQEWPEDIDIPLYGTDGIA